MRRLTAVFAVLFLGVGILSAETFTASITKVDGNKVTFHRVKKGEKGEATTLTAAKDVKVAKGKFNKEEKKVETGDAIEGGLKNAMFSKEGGVNARITTEGDKITEIIVTGGGKKKKDN